MLDGELQVAHEPLVAPVHDLVDLVRVGVGVGGIVRVGLELGTELGEGESRGTSRGSR